VGFHAAVSIEPVTCNTLSTQKQLQTPSAEVRERLGDGARWQIGWVLNSPQCIWLSSAALGCAGWINRHQLDVGGAVVVFGLPMRA
jgi:hypothetical protein